MFSCQQKPVTKPKGHSVGFVAKLRGHRDMHQTDHPVISGVEHDEEGEVSEDGDRGREEDDGGLGETVLA